MAIKFELNAQTRKEIGRGAARRLYQNEDRIPAIVYGAGKEPQNISVGHRDVVNALKNDAIYSHILTLHVDNQPEKVILKDLHRHPWKPRIMHVDFLRINEKVKLNIHVPIHFKGDATAIPGVKAGGVVSKTMNEIEVRCLPADLPESIDIDISNLELDQSIHLLDLKLPKGVEFAAQIDENHNPSIVSIHVPRAAVEETPAAEAAPEGGETKAEAKPEESSK